MSGTTGTTQPAPRATMLLVGARLTPGLVFAAVAALRPSLQSVWTDEQ